MELLLEWQRNVMWPIDKVIWMYTTSYMGFCNWNIQCCVFVSANLTSCDEMTQCCVVYNGGIVWDLLIDMFKTTPYCCGSPFLIALAILPPLLDFVFSPPLGKRSWFEKASLCRRPYALETLGVNYGREGWRGGEAADTGVVQRRRRRRKPASSSSRICTSQSM